MIDILGIAKQYGSKVLFEGADGRIGYRSRTALVGPNGAGKSTLIKMILGYEEPDTGNISRAKGLSVGHLAQEIPKASDRTVLQEVMRLDGRREKLLNSRAECEQDMAGGAQDPNTLEHYARILEEMESLDEYRLESRAKTILDGMGFAAEHYDRPLSSFSGGWLMRVALSRILLMDPDLLLLDEPTNHLDLESLLWLEEFLKRYRGALVLVSHDTAFLNKLVSEVIEIDQRKLWTYNGNLDSYVQQKQERVEVLKAQKAGQVAKIAEIEDFVRRFGAKASKARQAQSRLKQLDKIDIIDLPETRATVRFRFPPAPHSGREVVTLDQASFSYGEKPVYQNLDWVLQRGSRAAIVGVNGAGKTTLLRLLAGELNPTAGSLKYGHQVQVGYYAQHQSESLDPNKTVLEELQDSAPDMGLAQARGVAGAFLFSGDAAEKKIRVLSGGEKARVALGKLLLTPANFLILDEPTNHLDVESRGVLLEALQDFTGTLVLVSHDREFVEPLVNSVLEIAPLPGARGSSVKPLVSGYDDYIKRKELEASASATKLLASPDKIARATLATADSPTLAPRSAPSNNQRKSWERELSKLESEIAKLETEQSSLQAAASDPALYNDKPKLREHLERQRVVEQKLSASLERWEELGSLLS